MYGWKFSGNLILICSFSLCQQNFSKANCFRVHRKLNTWWQSCKAPISFRSGKVSSPSTPCKVRVGPPRFDNCQCSPPLSSLLSFSFFLALFLAFLLSLHFFFLFFFLPFFPLFFLFFHFSLFSLLFFSFLFLLFFGFSLCFLFFFFFHFFLSFLHFLFQVFSFISLFFLFRFLCDNSNSNARVSLWAIPFAIR